MKFHDHMTVYDYALRDRVVDRRTVSWQTYYDMQFKGLSKPEDDDVTKMVLILERRWWGARRPYYKVWPAITDSICRIKLDIPANTLNLTPRIVAVRFAVGGEVHGDAMSISSVLVLCLDGCLVVTGFGRHLSTGVPVQFMANPYSLSSPETLESMVLDLVPRKATFQGEEYVPFADSSLMLRVGLSVLLLADDPSIVEPDVLSKDELKYEQTKDQKYVDKAKRRGKVGWNIGKTFETIPHFRRPHLALRHTGKGRTVPRIVPVKACVVHRDKITRVPTGHLTPAGAEVE